MSPIYTIELSVDKTPVFLEFEILDRDNKIENPSNMTVGQQIAWRSMFANQYPVLVHRINGEPIDGGYAFAYTLKTGYCGTVLTGIRLNDVSYKSDVYNEYWFPGTEKPEELDDGCVEIHLLGKEEVLYANPSAKPPFMDLSGKFIEEYELTYEDKSSTVNPPNGSARDVPWRNLTATRPDFFAVVGARPLNSHSEASIQIINEEFCRIYGETNLKINYCIRYHYVHEISSTPLDQ